MATMELFPDSKRSPLLGKSLKIGLDETKVLLAADGTGYLAHKVSHWRVKNIEWIADPDPEGKPIIPVPVLAIVSLISELVDSL